MRSPTRNGLSALVALGVATAALFFGKPLLMPLALALLVSFCLAPLVLRVERSGLGRIPALIVVCLLVGSLLAGLGWLVARETAQLADAFPTYRANLLSKVRTLRGPVRSIAGAAESLSDLDREIQTPSGERPAPKVEVVEAPSVIAKVSSVLTSVLEPLGVAGIVAVLALFMLLEREELRDRLIWLTGGGDLSLTTHALEDAERRVARYLGTQSLLCALHGIGVGVGLLLIGVPGAVVWGTLSALLRFLPYFGPWIAAAPPILLSLAAFPDWHATAWSVGLFVLLELVSNNLLEPWLYGTSAGLSPFGVVLSAFFWTWLWGIPGLLLATPLGVCLVVAGRYVRALEFLSVLLGDQPALAAEMRFTQRLLALDLDESDAVLRRAAQTASLEQLSDRLVLPAFRRLAEDDERDLVPEERSGEVRRHLAELLEELLERRGDEATDAFAGVAALFVPARSEGDAAAGRWLARVLARQGATTSLATARALVSEIVEGIGEASPDLVCISALTPSAVPHARLLCARLSALHPGLEIVVGLWAAPEHELPRVSARSEGARWINSTAELTAALHSLRGRLPAAV